MRSDNLYKLPVNLPAPPADVLGGGMTLIKRLTLIGRRGRIETCLYPVFPPDGDAENVLRHIRMA